MQAGNRQYFDFTNFVERASPCGEGVLDRGHNKVITGHGVDSRSEGRINPIRSGGDASSVWRDPGLEGNSGTVVEIRFRRCMHD